MMIQVKKIHIILGMVVLTQMGCNKGAQRTASIYPMVPQNTQQLQTGDRYLPTGNNSLLSTIDPLRVSALARETERQRLADIAEANRTKNLPDVDAQKKKEDEEKRAAAAKNKPQEDFTVVIDEEPLWITSCKEVGGDLSKDADTDGDGITDECEDKLSTTTDLSKKLVGLDKNVFNGALVAGKRYIKEREGFLGIGPGKPTDSKTSIRLTKEEEKAYDAKSNALGKFGSGVDSKFDRQAAKKFVALSAINGGDAKGFRALFELEQKVFVDKFKSAEQAYLPIISGSNGSRADVRDPTEFGGTKITKANTTSTATDEDVKKRYALVRNNNRERIPFNVDDDGSFVAGLSGIASSTTTLRENEEFVYIAETNLVVPLGGLNLRIGQLTSDRTKAVAGSKSGMFYVMTGNHSLIVSSDLIANKNDGGQDLSKTSRPIDVPPHCKTMHIVIAYFADDHDSSDDGKAVFAENVFYKSKEGWKHLPQEWMRVKPLDKTSAAVSSSTTGTTTTTATTTAASATGACGITDDEILFQDAKDALK